MKKKKIPFRPAAAKNISERSGITVVISFRKELTRCFGSFSEREEAFSLYSHLK